VISAQPLLILLPAWWFYGEKVSARTAVALVVGFGGLLAVAVPGGGGGGAALSLLAAVGITGGTLLSRLGTAATFVVLPPGLESERPGRCAPCWVLGDSHLSRAGLLPNPPTGAGAGFRKVLADSS
jgi:drug/metabolite transporter (DMT)-like permease